jgi:predicted metal-dependent hydrolase
MPKGSVEHTFIEVGEQKIPAKIYREVRRSVRFSIARKGAILRMPLLMLPHEQRREVANFRDWVRKQIIAKQKLQEHFTPKDYKTGDTLEVGIRTYKLIMSETENKTHSAKLAGRNIHLRLAAGDNDLHRQKAVKHLLSRVVAQDFLPGITRRVLELNHQHFQKDISSVNLKYNLSNWGSCSTKGNINLSSIM